MGVERDRGRGNEGAGSEKALSPSSHCLTQFMRKAKSGDFTTGDTWHSNHADDEKFPSAAAASASIFCGERGSERGGGGRCRCAFPNYDFQSERAFPREIGRGRASLLIKQ